MWVLPKNLIQSHSSQVMEELSEVLNLQESQSITLPFVKSKPMSLRTLSQKWKKGGWIRALYGRMLKHSQGSSFLDEWTSSLGVSLANRSVLLEAEKEMMTQDTSSLLSSEQLSPSDLLEFYLRMSKGLSAPSSEGMDGQTPKEHLYCSMSLESWKDEVTKQRGAYLARAKQVRLIREKESLSSVNWQTPTVMMPDETPESFMARKKRNGFKNGTTIPNLLVHVKMEEQKNWGAPTAGMMKQDSPNPQYAQNLVERGNQIMLPAKVSLEESSGQVDQDKLSSSGKSRELYLNPEWVEGLMGLELYATLIPTVANGGINAVRCKNLREILLPLWREVGAKEIWKKIGRVPEIQEEEILRFRLYGISKDDIESIKRGYSEKVFKCENDFLREMQNNGEFTKA